MRALPAMPRAVLTVLAVLAAGLLAACTSARPSAAAARAPAAAVAPAAPEAITELSAGCPGQNAETEQAVDGQYEYVTWIGCGGIAFDRSADGGRRWDRPVTLPLSAGQGSYSSGIATGIPKGGWDPSIAVAPDRTVYVAYMVYRQGSIHPVVAVSSDHGATFGRISQPRSPVPENWGDRDFIAVAPDGAVYLTWDFGPSLGSRHGNIVFQRSADGGRTWSPFTVVSPGYPSHGGGVAAPLLVEPSGRIDLAFWDWGGGAIKPYALTPDLVYFMSSSDGGRTWSAPVAIRPDAGKIGFLVTWIDVNLSIDAAGNLYATWDTQSPGGDIGWLSYSADHGRTWSRQVRVTPDHDNAQHIMAVEGGSAGVAYTGWLSDNAKAGFAQYLRPFSIRAGWLTGPVMVSREFGAHGVWPGDTIGVSLLPGRGPVRVLLSWGSAVNGVDSEVFTRTVTG